MTSELVSIIIPTYYRNEYLREAVKSVKKQTYPNIELIVVDDSGMRHAEPVIASFDDINYIPLEENKGANGARNIGFNKSTGKYVQFLDDDDLLCETKIKEQVQHLKSHDETQAIYCGVKFDSEDHLPKKDARGDVLQYALTFSMWPCMNSTLLADRDVLSKVTPLADRSGGDDLGFIIKLAAITQFGFINKPLVSKRKIEGSRGESIGAIEGRKQIIRDHSELYDQFPSRIRNTALAKTYNSEGELLLQNNIWSLSAIVAFIKEGYFDGYSVKNIGRILASLFGRPGWGVAKRVINIID